MLVAEVMDVCSEHSGLQGIFHTLDLHTVMRAYMQSTRVLTFSFPDSSSHPTAALPSKHWPNMLLTSALSRFILLNEVICRIHVGHFSLLDSITINLLI